MRIALVSPYSWTYPGGVTRHIEALAEQFLADGHDVRVLAPFDPPDRLQRASAPRRRARRSASAPDYAGPARAHDRLPGQRRGVEPRAARRRRRDAAPRAARRAASTSSTSTSRSRRRSAGTRSTVADAAARRHVPLLLGERACSHSIANAARRAAPAEPPARADRRLRGRRLDRRAASTAAATGSSPTASTLPDEPPVPRAPATGEPLRIAFVGQAVERKGLPVLLRAFEALREHVPAELTIVGADAARRSSRCCSTRRGVRVSAASTTTRRTRVLRDADVLCAPSLGGESFGMVLTEAFAAGTPVVASDIAGYRDVVRDGVDGVLVPRGDATALAETLRDLALDPSRRAAHGAAAAEQRASATPGRASPPRSCEAYEDAIARAGSAHRPGATARVASGARPADGLPRVAAAPRLPSLEPRAGGAAAARARRMARRAGARRASRCRRSRLACARAPAHRRRQRSATSLARARSPSWVLAGARADVRCRWCCAPSPGTRSCAPRCPACAVALPRRAAGHVDRRADVRHAAGAPRRALARAVVARRLGRPRERLPVVLGTLVSQTLLNVARAGDPRHRRCSRTVGLFAGHQRRAASRSRSLPVACSLAVLVAAGAAARGVPARSRRVARAGSRQARGALTQRARGPARLPRAAARADRRRSRSSRAWALQWLACYVLLRRARARRPGRPRRRGRGPVRGQRHRGAAGHAVEPRRLPGRLRRRADRRLRRRRRPTRSATGSSCRPSRSRPRSIMGTPALLKEGLSGGTSACARCTRRRCGCAPRALDGTESPA